MVEFSRRLNVQADPQAYPCRLAYVDRDQKVWWELHFLHYALREAGYNLRKKDWLRWCKQQLQPFPLDAVWTKSDTPRDSVTNVCTSFGVCFLLSTMVDRSRADCVADRALLTMKHIASRACETLTQDSLVPGTTLQAQGDLVVTAAGRVKGLNGNVSADSSLARPLQQSWHGMHARGVLCEPWEQDSHALADVVTWLVGCMQERRRRVTNKLSASSGRRWTSFVVSWFRWMAQNLETHLFQVYGVHHNMGAPVPAKKAFVHNHAPATSRGSKVAVEPDVAWEILQQAQASGVSPAQVLRVRAGDAHVGCHALQGVLWSNKRETMYVERRDLGFCPGISHWNLILDPATHSKKEAMVGVAWSWESQIGCFPDFQWVPASKTITAREQAMPEELAEMAAESRLERVASFRQLQAMSHMLHKLSNERIKDIGDLCLPEDVLVQPVQAGEVRVVEHGPATSRAKIINTVEGTCRDVLPLTCRDPWLVVLGLDQGSMGTAGVAFANTMRAMLRVRWDKYHRVVRDVKLALTHSHGGIFLKALLYSSYLWSVNRKPFGTGCFGTQKTWLMNVFFAVHDRDSDLWRKYGWKIARDHGMPFRTDEEQEAVWKHIATTSSFVQAGEDTKLGRWFSWNASAHKYLREFHTTKMLLEAHVPDIPDPDGDGVAWDDLDALATSRGTPREQLSKLKATTGGLRLAYKLMHCSLHECLLVMYVATQAAWSWYTREVQEVKSPRQGLVASLAASQGRWASDRHLGQGVAQTLYHQRNLTFMLCDGPDPLAASQGRRACNLALHILAQRAWSMAVRHNGPPEVYVPMLFREQALVDRVAQDMSQHWLKVTRVEQKRLSSQVRGFPPTFLHLPYRICRASCVVVVEVVIVETMLT